MEAPIVWVNGYAKILAPNGLMDQNGNPVGPELKNKWFPVEYTGNIGNYRVRSLASGGAARLLSGIAPANLTSVTAMYLYMIPSSGAALSNRDLNIFVDYAGIGEPYNINTASDVTSTFNLSGLANIVHRINISYLFTNLSANDVFGIQMSHGPIGGSIDYLGLLMEYI